MAGSTTAGWVRAMLLGLLAVVAILALAVAGGLAFPNILKPLASYLSETLTGRTLAVAGNLDLEVSLQPRVTARSVSFGNADWSSEPVMASAAYVTVQLDLQALLDRRLHLLDLDVRGVNLLLEDRVNGEPNWQLFGDADDGAGWSFMLEGLQLEAADIRASIGELEPIHLEIPTLTESSDPAGNLQLDGHGRLNGDPWRLNGSIGTLENLLSGGRIELDLDMTVDDTDIQVAGSIGELATLSELDLQLSMYGPDTEVLGEIFGMPEAFQEDVALTANLKPAASGHAVDIEGHVSRFEVSAAGTVLNLENLDGWDGEIDLSGPDAGVFGKALQIAGFPDGPFTVRGRLHLHGGDLDLTDVAITTEDVNLTLSADFADFPRREGASASIRLDGPDISQFNELLRIPTLPAAAFTLSLTLDATGNEMTSELILGSHVLAVEGTLGEYPTFTDTRLEAALGGQEFGEILRLANLEDSLHGSYESTAELTIDERGFSASNIIFNTGPFKITGTAYLPDPAQPQDFTMTVALDVSSLATAGSQLGITALPDEPLTLQATLASSDGRLVLEESAADFRHMRGSARGSLGKLGDLTDLDIELDVRGSNIDELFEDAIPDLDSKIPFELSGRVRGQAAALELIGIELRGTEGAFTLNGVLSLAEAYVGSSFSITGGGANLAGLLPAFPYYTPPRETWEVEAEIEFPDAARVQLQQSSLRVGSVNASISGTLDVNDLTGTDLTFEASGDSFNDIGQTADIAWPDIPFEISTKLDGSQDAINISRWQARWGASDLTASGSVRLTEKPLIVLRGKSSTMILVDLQKALFGEPEAQQPAEDLGRVFPAVPIPIDDLQLFDADIDIEVDEFRGMRASLDDVRLDLIVKDGVLELERAAYRDDIGSFDATAMLRPLGEGQVHLDMNLLGEEAEFRFLTSADQPPETIPRFTLDIAISGSGATVAELAGNLNGNILVFSGDGRIDNALLDAYASDFLSQVLDVLNPFIKSETFTPVECMVINAQIENGILNLEPGFVMRTDRVNTFVLGKVNLKSERLDLSLATQARRGIGISAASITNPFFKVGGTLAAPALQLDPANAAIAASVATATAGLSIVIRGVWDRLMGERNPCPQFRNYQPGEKAAPSNR